MNIITKPLNNTLLVLLLVLGIENTSIQAQSFAGGSGTQADPYQVATVSQLNDVRNYASAHFKQTANIDLNVAPYNSGAGWLPVPLFSGTYDGNGFTISNLMINRPNANNVGLFESTNGATLTDLTLTNVSVKGHSYVGALVGFASASSSITRVQIKGATVNARFDGGGITGRLSASTISESNVSVGHIDSKDTAGGLVGYQIDGVIRKSYTVGGSVTATGGAGGLVGISQGNSITSARVATSYSSGMNITTSASWGYSGGLIGSMEGTAITNSYSINRVSGVHAGGLVSIANDATITTSYSASVATGSNPAGLVSSAGNNITIVNSYYNEDSTSVTTSYGTELSTEEMSQQAFFTGWDFSSIWVILTEGEAFPELRVFGVLFAGGSGTRSDPYQVKTDKDLNRVRLFPSAHFKQVVDISLKAYQSGDGWLPVPGFTGTYDGGGYTISDLVIKRQNTNKVGLFADVNGATLTNLTLYKPKVTGKSFVGALAGVMNSSSSVSKIQIKGEENSVEDSVKGADYVGGLVGSNNEGSIELSAVTDMYISATGDTIGGLAGAITGSQGSVINSYAINKLSSSGNSQPGALVGYLSGTITNSYAIDKGVPDPPKLHHPDPDNTNYLYELVNSNGGTITNSYYICNPDDNNKNEAGICTSDTRRKGNGTPLNMFGMRRHASFPGFDFTNIWYLDPEIPSDSPRLRALSLTPPEFAGGSGTMEDPYLVLTVIHLANIGLNPSAHYRQIADIYVGGPFRNNHTSWRPLPNFTGTYDGNGHTLSGLRVHWRGFDNIGLFSKVTGGTLTNIVLDKPDVIGSDKVGALVGEVSSTGYVTKVRVTGGWLKGKEKVGGLVGSNEGAISLIASTGITIEGSGYIIGGLVGYTRGTDSRIDNSYAINNISSTEAYAFLGGLVGFASSGSITNSYTASSGSDGVVGSNGGTITNSYFNSDLSRGGKNGVPLSWNGTPLTDTEMKQQASFSGFDFANTWIMFNEGGAFPNLRAFPDAGSMYAEGSGTEADPYRVATPNQLNNIRFFPNLHFRQTANIDLGTPPFDTGEGWDPILSFSGSYDGGGFIISNLFIDRGTTNNVGLFGILSGGNVTNLGLMKVSVKGKENVGALAGYLTTGSEIRDSYAKGGTIQANKTTGGLVGKGVGLKVGTSYSSGISISAATDIGGLAGEMRSFEIKDSYAFNRLTGDESGGLVGTANNGQISTSYSSSTNKGNKAGGLISNNGATITNSYYNSDSTSSSNNFGTALSDEKMRQQASFVGFEFINTWQITGGSFPELRTFGTFSFPYPRGIGTQDDPFQVSTAKQLDSVRNFSSAHFIQTADINLGVNPYKNDPGWNPIPNFKGSYDGNGFAISNLNIYRLTTENLGLFAKVTGAKLSNITLKNPSVFGNHDNIGVLAGVLKTSATSVTGVRVIGGRVRGTNKVGGLAGSSEGKIRLSAVTGTNIIGFDILGGLVGSTIGSGNSITNSYSTSKLSGSYLAGGLVGRMNGTAITNSYSASEITGTVSGATAGGLVGEKTGGSISNSYYNKDYVATSAGGSGLSTAQMQRKASFVGFDFSNIWIMFSEGGLLPGLQTFVDFNSLFAGGSGTQADPYQISKADHLYNVRFFPEAHFKQTANINLGIAPFNSDKGWLPIQDLTGIYDGGGYTISNLKIDRPVADTVGLFAKVTGARLTKLALSKPSVTGRNVVGALAGAINSAAKVNKIKITGGSITGGTNLGGLAGSNKGAISQSAATGMTIQGSGSIIGGLAGSTSGSGSSISDSYATNSVSSSVTGIFPGALLGVLNSGEVTKSYAVNSGSKGIVGTNSRGTITRSYFNGISTIGEGTGRFLTTAQMRQQHSFTGFDFDTTWVMLNERGAFPELRAFVADYGVMFAGGLGTKEKPYKITTAKQLYHVRQLPSRYYRQTADIDLGVAPYIHGKGWLPIQKFKGSYDGGGFSISNITMIHMHLTEAGLFGKLDGGTLTNLDILTPDVMGKAHTGALVGSGINGCSFSGIRVSGGSVSGIGSSNGIGALAGLTNSCTVSDIEVSGVNINVVGNVAGDVGGVIGKGTNTAITRARISDLNLQSESDAGGIAGELIAGSSVIESSVTGGNIENGDHSGGLVGRMASSSITNSYSNIAVNGTAASAGLVASLTGGSITTSYSSPGGIRGDNPAGLVNSNTGGTITNSYYNSTAISNSNGNGTPLTETQMKKQASFTGFDFSRIWFIDEDISFPGFQERKENELIIAGKQGWRMLTSPLHSHSIGTLFQDLWLQGFKGADMETGSPNLFFWDEVSKKWTAPTDTAFVPGGGKGFLMYVYSDDDADGTPEGFPKRLGYSGSGFSGNHTVNLTYTNSGSEDNDGWHLVGNPYPSTVYWRAGKGWIRKHINFNIHIWDASADNGKGKYETLSILPGVTEGKIAPWQSFWVNTSKSTAITFSDAVKSAGGTLLKQVKEPSQVIPRVTLELEGNGLSSKSIVLFHEQAEAGKDSLDAYKLHSLNLEDYLLLGTSVDGKRVMEIQALPYEEVPKELELVMEGSDLNGEFTLNWVPTDLPEGWVAELVDSQTGEAYSLADTASYTFILNEEKAGPKEKETSNEIGIPVSPITPVIKSKTAPARFVIRIGLVTSNETDPDLPLTVELQQNYPNPFNPSTTIAFGIPETGKVTLEVFDVLGRKVVTLLDDENKTAGRHNVRFNASNLASGMYLYRLRAGDITKIKKLTLIK